MKKLLFIFFVLLYTSVAMAAIDECKTDIYFANGILTDEGNATVNTILLKRSIQKETYQSNLDEYEKHIGKVAKAYNSTHKTYWDMIESAAQKFGMQWLKDKLWDTVHKADLSKQIDSYRASIEEGHKVLAVAHSQGNLFTYEAYRGLTNAQALKIYF